MPRISKNRQLLVINDEALRKKAAFEAQQLLAKMDRLGRAQGSSAKLDEKLFTEWETLTFGALKQEIAGLRIRYHGLCTFHNRLVTLAEQRGLAPEEAYAFLQDEEAAYQAGNAAARARIEREREERDRAAQQEEREADEEESFSSFEEECPEGGDDETNDFWAFVAEKDEAAVRELCRQEYHATEVMVKAALEAKEPNEIRLTLRLWSWLTKSVAKAARKSYANATAGASLDQTLKLMHAFWEERKAAEERRGKSRRARRSPFLEGSTDTQEELKSLYRRFVRHLHPDRQDASQGESEWQRMLWHDGQQAYQEKDFLRLEQLYKIAMLRLGRLQELTMGELRESKDWLLEDLRVLEANAKQLRKAPFWKFSSRKNHDALERKISKTLAAEKSALETQVRELAGYHEFLAKQRPTSKKRAERKAERKQARPPEPQQADLFGGF